MKKLLLALIIFLAANTLSAFDKVWELQFSSTPHHVHYTEGHKELIVGEGNTFKKYNAETGALIDSVVYSLDALKDYTIGEYHVTDDLKSLYVLAMLKDDNKNEFLFRVSIENNFNYDSLFSQNYLSDNGSYIYLNAIPGQLNKIGKEKFMYSFNSNSNYSPIYTASSGIIRIFEKNNIDNSGGSLRLYRYNSYIPTLLLYTKSSSSQKNGPNGYSTYSSSTAWTSPPNNITKLNNLDKLDLQDIYVVNLSKNNKYIYFSSGKNITRFDYLKNNFTSINFKPNGVLPLIKDDEIVINNNGKLYHYNFKVNVFLDSIDLGLNNTYTTDLNNDYLVSINESYITTYKSSSNPNKVISYLKDSIITKSVGDTITLNAISNLNPLKEEWDLGDGRAMSGDTIQFAYPKKGEYLVKYTGTYKDTVVNLTCKIKVFDTLSISFTHKVEMKQGYTELTITSEFSGDFDKVIYNPNPSKGKTDLAYVIIDSTLNKVTYKIFTSDIYYFAVSIGNSIKTISKSIELIIPVNNIKNTDYNLVGLKRVINIIPHKEEIYFQDYNYSYTTIYPDNQNGPGAYKISVNCLLNTVNNAFQRETKISSNWASSIGTSQAGIESIAIYRSRNKMYLKNNMLLYCDDLSGKLHIIQDKIESFLNSTVDMSSITYLDMQSFNDKYLFYTYYPNNNPVSIGVVNSLYNVSKSNLIGKKYNEKNHDLFCYGTLCVLDTNIYMLVHNTNYKAHIYKLNSDFDILDTIATYPYLRSYSRAINGKYAYSLIDSSNNSKSKQLVSINIEKKTSIGFKLDTTINYHQVFQLKKDVSCLIGTKNNDLIIQAFKDGETTFTDFVIPINIPFNIVGMTKDNELHLNYTASGTISSYIRTKGFADIFKSLETINPFDDKDKTFIVAKDNNFGSIQQSSDYSYAKVIFKDSLDLSSSLVKIYTETGDEILTYNLSKDQKELPIRTDKLYHGTYFVRLFTQSEEHNLGKFIIVR